MTHRAESANLRTDVVSSSGGGWRFLLIARHVCSSTQPSEWLSLACVLEHTNCRGYLPDTRKLGEPNSHLIIYGEKPWVIWPSLYKPIAPMASTERNLSNE